MATTKKKAAKKTPNKKTSVKKTATISTTRKKPAAKVNKSNAAKKPATVKKTPIVKVAKPQSAAVKARLTMLQDEFEQLSHLKSRLDIIGRPTKKSELIRAGIQVLATMTDAGLKSAVAKVPVIADNKPKK